MLMLKKIRMNYEFTYDYKTFESYFIIKKIIKNRIT